MYLRKSIFMLNFVNCIRFFIIVHSINAKVCKNRIHADGTIDTVRYVMPLLD